MDIAQWAHAVRQADSVEFWFGTLFLLLLTVVAFYFISRFLHRLRIVADTPTSRIRSAAQGYVELDGSGELMKGTPIISPLTGTTCTWYRYKIEERTESYDSRGNRTTHWRTIQSDTSDNLFLVKDDTGECVIDPEGADVIPMDDDTWYGSSAAWSGAAPRANNGMGRFLSSGRYRFSEKRMHPRDPIYAIGLFRSVGGHQELPNTKEDVRQLLNEWKRDSKMLHQRFDENDDGLIDMQEWDKARKTAHREILKEQAERFKGPVTHIMTKPKDARRPFILSVLPQHTMVRRFRYYAVAAMAGFLLGGGGVTWLLTARFTLS